MRPNNQVRPNKRKVHVAMQVLLEMEIFVDYADYLADHAGTMKKANDVLRHKVQTFAALNHDIGVSQLTVKKDGKGFDVEPLP